MGYRSGLNATATDILSNQESLKGQRSNFDSYWQTLHDYYYVESENLNKSYYPGTELDFTYLWDSTSLEAADVLASGFMSYLTPPSGRWFKLRTKNPLLLEQKAVSTYLEDVEAEVYHALNNSNFYSQMYPAYKSSGVYGTSILLEEEDVEDGIRFYSLPLKQTCIVEDSRERVKEYYIEFEYTAYQAVSRFGKENVSVSVNEAFLSGRNPDKKFKYILYIGPRYARNVSLKDNQNMPIKATWVEKESKKVIKEGGYEEMPAMGHRFDKRPYIAWGFSPAMKALPDVRTLNLEAKTTLRAAMKQTDPPIAVPNNAFLSPLNMNPRAVNYYKKDSLDGNSTIMPFGNYGNLQAGMISMEYRRKHIKEIMYNNVFLAFEGITKQMNNPEIEERIFEKMTLLGPAVGRYLTDYLDPIINRTIAILARRGSLPMPPDEIILDPRYEIEYSSMLALAQKKTELQGLMSALTVVGQVAQMKPEILDKIDQDKVADGVWGITAAPVQMLRDDREVALIREQRGQMQAMEQEAAVIQGVSEVAKTHSETQKNLADARAKDRA